MIGWDELDIHCGAVEKLLADATDQVLRPPMPWTTSSPLTEPGVHFITLSHLRGLLVS